MSYVSCSRLTSANESYKRIGGRLFKFGSKYRYRFVKLVYFDCHLRQCFNIVLEYYINNTNIVDLIKPPFCRSYSKALYSEIPDSSLTTQFLISKHILII